MKKFVLTLLVALVAVTSFAYDVKVDGIYYNLNNEEIQHNGTKSGNPIYRQIAANQRKCKETKKASPIGTLKSALRNRHGLLIPGKKWCFTWQGLPH